MERPEEQGAADLVARTLQLTVRLHDCGEHAGEFDYLIDHADEPMALEVTSYQDQQHREQLAAWDKYAADGWHTPRLARCWVLSADAGRRVPFKTLVERCAPVLHTLEKLGRQNFYALHKLWSEDMHDRGLARTLDSLGVTSVYGYGPGDRGTGIIDVTIATGGFSVLGPGSVLGELEAFVAHERLADVRRKLAASGLPHRHAFVWVTTLAPMGAWWNMTKERALPTRPPQLPSEVTDISWIAASGGMAMECLNRLAANRRVASCVARPGEGRPGCSRSGRQASRLTGQILRSPVCSPIYGVPP
jgi:hypothetical protein